MSTTATLTLDSVDDCAWVYVNGTLLPYKAGQGQNGHRVPVRGAEPRDVWGEFKKLPSVGQLFQNDPSVGKLFNHEPDVTIDLTAAPGWNPSGVNVIRITLFNSVGGANLVGELDIGTDSEKFRYATPGAKMNQLVEEAEEWLVIENGRILGAQASAHYEMTGDVKLSMTTVDDHASLLINGKSVPYAQVGKETEVPGSNPAEYFTMGLIHHETAGKEKEKTGDHPGVVVSAEPAWKSGETNTVVLKGYQSEQKTGQAALVGYLGAKEIKDENGATVKDPKGNSEVHFFGHKHHAPKEGEWIQFAYTIDHRTS